MTNPGRLPWYMWCLKTVLSWSSLQNGNRKCFWTTKCKVIDSNLFGFEAGNFDVKINLSLIPAVSFYTMIYFFVSENFLFYDISLLLSLSYPSQVIDSLIGRQQEGGCLDRKVRSNTRTVGMSMYTKMWHLLHNCCLSKMIRHVVSSVRLSLLLLTYFPIFLRST